MNPKTKLATLYTLIFYFIFSLFSLFSKLQQVTEKILKTIQNTPMANQSTFNKFQQHLQKLTKIPIEVVLSVEIPQGKMKQENWKFIVECLVYYVEVIKNMQIARVALHLWGNDEDVHKITQIMKESTIADNCPNFLIPNYTKYYQNLKNFAWDHKKQEIPLIICMGSYPSLNCLHFSQLIDAQFAFCPNLEQCDLFDLQKCFDQYAGSKQRHGK